MAEYIEREAVLKHKTLIPGFVGEYVHADRIREAPAADVVEVPCRCKDCKHWMDFPNCGCTDAVKVCALAEYMIGQNGYCLYGERKGG